jgi:hypothetical protein
VSPPGGDQEPEETAVSALTSSSPSRPLIARTPFFWWLRELQLQTTAREARPAYVASPDAYIPAGTADLWRSARPRSVR